MWVVDLESQTVMQLVYIATDYSPMRGHQKARPFKKEKYIIITNTHTHKAISHTGCREIIWRIWERDIVGWTLCKPCDHTRWVQLPQAVSVERKAFRSSESKSKSGVKASVNTAKYLQPRSYNIPADAQDLLLPRDGPLSLITQLMKRNSGRSIPVCECDSVSVSPHWYMDFFFTLLPL